MNADWSEIIADHADLRIADWSAIFADKLDLQNTDDADWRDLHSDI